MDKITKKKAYFHLPGLFEFCEFYEVFLPLFFDRREYFYEWCDIGSIYGAPADCVWGGGRVGYGKDDADDVLKLMQKYGISARLTFSNSFAKARPFAFSMTTLTDISLRRRRSSVNRTTTTILRKMNSDRAMKEGGSHVVFARRQSN